MHHTFTHPALSKEDVKAMQECKSVAIDMLPNTDDTVISRLRLIRPPEGNWAGGDLTYTVDVDYSVMDYADKYSNETDRNCGFYHIGSATYNDEWQALCKLVRPGDSLCIRWYANAGSQIMRDAGLHLDEVKIQIYRLKGEHYLPYLALHMGTDIGKYDSIGESIRMLRHTEPRSDWR